MEVTGKIKLINETQTFGASDFRKRELVLTTSEQYPQMLMIEFVQDKCDLLNSYTVGQEVKISINLRGREWINPEGVAKYFNSIQGWRIEALEITEGMNRELPPLGELGATDDPDDSPF